MPNERRDAGYVTVVDHDPTWAERFAAEAARIGEGLRGAGLAGRVEHVGSTSVPGLVAKPIVDVQVSLGDRGKAEAGDLDAGDLDAVDRWTQAFAGLGYVHVAYPGTSEYPFLYRADEHGTTLFHAHLCRPGSLHEARHLAVRDHLRAHPEEAAAYGGHKRRLAVAVDGDRDAYIAGKDAFVKALEDRARAACGLPRRLRRVAAFCGSRHGVRAAYGEAARQLGEMLAADGIGLVYGAGDVGLMGEVAAAALTHGGAVEGYIPRHLVAREIEHPAGPDRLGVIGEQHVVGSMHERKASMAARADAFVALPGGFGTLDELFEIVTWRQLGLHDKPVGLLDTDGFWRPLLALADHLVTEGFVSARARRAYLHTATSPGPLLDQLGWAAPTGPSPFPTELA